MAVSLIGVSITRSRPEFCEEPFGRLERAAVDSDILAESHDGRIAIHFFEERLANRFEHGDFGHR